MKISKYIVAVTLMMALLIPTVNAVTYKWHDANGRVVYSQTPPRDGTAYETLDTIKPSHTSPAPVPTPETSKAVADMKARAKERDKEADLAAEQAKNKELRQDKCKAARENLDTYTVYKRIRQPDGSVVRVPDDVREQKIKEYTEAVKEFCD